MKSICTVCTSQLCTFADFLPDIGYLASWMILVDQMPTVHGTLGSTFGKHRQEQNVTGKLKDREAFLQKHSVLTGIDRFDAVVRGFDIKLAKKSGALNRVKKANFAHRRVKCQSLQNSSLGEKESCKHPVRSARERQVKVTAEISKQHGFRPSTAPLPAPYLKVVGKTFAGSLLENTSQQKPPVEGTRATTARSCPVQHGMHCMNCSSAGRFYRGPTPTSSRSCKPFSGIKQVSDSRKSNAPIAALSIVGLSRETGPGKESEKLSNSTQISQVEGQKPYLVTSTDCPIIRRMRPARYCMPARVFYGSLRAGIWSPDGDSGFGRIQVFPDSCS